MKTSLELTVTGGMHFVRTKPNAGIFSRVICGVREGAPLKATREKKGWYYIPSIGGWINERAVSVM